MSRGLKWFTGITVTVFVAIGTLLYLVRFNDGPMEIISGGPFISGELVTDVDDWSFLSGRATIELQTMLPPRSRTMWLVVYDNRLFVLSSYMNTMVGKVWKKWPRTIEKNNLAVVRADNRLYRLQLIRHHDGEFVEPVLELFNEKYHTSQTADDIEAGNAWLFELTTR